MDDLKETRAGLPNTCSKCGKPVGPSWFAPNDDVAASGGGLCASCAGQPQTFEERAQANPALDELAQNVANVLRDAQGVSNERVLRPAPEAQAPARGDRADLPAANRQAADTLKAKR